MFDPGQYQLIDFGAGRKLERFGQYTLDRPSPPASGRQKARPAAWTSADFFYRRRAGARGHWQPTPSESFSWTLTHTVEATPLVLQLRLTPFGHLGIFPEQDANWEWITRQVRRASRPLRVLNLFAYTGASSLVAAAAGAEVTHVDSARNIIGWARQNARLSGLADAPIRWIAEDARKFVEREVRRGNRYDAVLLDPPSYGHGVKGSVWKIQEHLGALLDHCGQLTERRPAFALLTCHSVGFGPERLRQVMLDAFEAEQLDAGSLEIAAADGRSLPSGAFARLQGRLST